MANTREIKRRIRAILSTKKITKAMELVAAAKMRKAVEHALMGRRYAEHSWKLLTALSEKRIESHPLLAVRPVKKICMIVISSDRGLCGAYNSQLMKKAIKHIRDPKILSVNRIGDEKIISEIDPKDIEIDILTVGKKGEEFFKRMNASVAASFIKLGDRPTISDISPIVKISIDDYRREKYDKIVVAYTDFVSAVVQIPKFRQLLPISKHDLEKVLREIGEEGMYKEKEPEEKNSQLFEYLFEPSPDAVLEEVLSRLVEVQLYQMILESSASEHSARMVAMKNANEAAQEMLFDLTLQFNQARQTSITQEIAEISGGKAVLEQGA